MHGRPCRQAWRQDRFLPREARVGRWKLWTGSPPHLPATEEAKGAKRCCEGALTGGWCEGVDPRESRQETPDARGSSRLRRGNRSHSLHLSFSNWQRSKDTSCEVFLSHSLLLLTSPSPTFTQPHQRPTDGPRLAPNCPYSSFPRLFFLLSFSFLSRLQGNCQDLFHACPLAAGSTLTMGGHTAEGGRTARHTAMGSARDPRARASTAAPGPTASSCWAYTPGLAGTPTRALGHRARDTAWGWRIKAVGCTRESGRMASRDGTACGRARGRVESTKGRGITGSRMDTALRHTRMGVREGVF